MEERKKIDRKKFWQNKRVLITGHTGFKGSWLSLWLQTLGAIVLGFALDSPTEPSLFEIASVEEKMKSVIGDVRDLTFMQTIFKEFQPDIVIHLAAQSLVRKSYKHPLATFSTNVMGTANLLDCVRNTDSVRVAVCITSDKCYQNKEWVWGYRESDALGGYDPYSTSKACAELVISSYRDSYFRPEMTDNHGVLLASTRAGNVVGGGDWAKDRLVPDIMRAMMEGHAVIIRNPHSTRPWQHVLEPLNGYLMLAEHLWAFGMEFSGPWNFGPNDGDVKPVSRICDYLTRRWGEGASWQLDSEIHPHENTLLKLDCSKARQTLNWYPKLNLEASLELIVEWFKAYQNKADMKLVTIDQIQRFEAIG